MRSHLLHFQKYLLSIPAIVCSHLVRLLFRIVFLLLLRILRIVLCPITILRLILFALRHEKNPPFG